MVDHSPQPQPGFVPSFADRRASASSPLEDADRIQLARTLQILSVIVALSALPALIHDALGGWYKSVWVMIFHEMCIAASYLLSRNGRIEWAARTLAYSTILCACLFLSISSQGFHNAAILMFPMALVLGAQLIDRRAYVRFAAVAGFGLTLIAVFEGRGVLPLKPGTMPDYGFFIDTGLILLITAVVASLVAGGLRKSLSLSRQYGRALQSLIAATNSPQQDFFEGLATELGKVLGVKYVTIGELMPGLPSRVRTIAFLTEGRITANIEFDLAGTPGEDTVRADLCCHPDDVQSLFPDDPQLQTMGVISYIGAPLKSASGEAIGIIAVMDEVPIESFDLAKSLLTIFATRAASELERGMVSRALRESEERYRTTLQNLGEGIVTFDADGRFLLANPAAERIFGVAAGRLAGRELAEFALGGADAQAARGKPGWLSESGSFEVDLMAGDGIPRLVHVTNAPQRDPAGRHTASLCVLRDITASRRMEQHLGLLAHALGSASDCISICDAEDRIIYVNESFRKTYGYDEPELLGQSIRIVRLCPDSSPDQALTAGGSPPANWSGELWNRARDGREFPVSLSTAVIHDDQGRFLARIGAARDITEQRALQEQYMQAQKLEAIGRLAGGIAHDFNNLLTVINGYSGMLLSSIDEKDRARPTIAQINYAGKRAAELTQQLLTFSRKEIFQPIPIDLNILVRESETMFRRLLGEDIRLEASFQPGCQFVMADPGQMHQVIMNLAVNARDAMPSGGTLSIAVAETELPAGPVTHPAGVESGSYVLLTVTDSGMGMSEETQSHIFEPFFSTKGSGGTGLGLATVYGIVRQNNGGIHVVTSPGRGTSFHIYLPKIQPELLSRGASEPVRAGHRPAATVLVVEDQRDVREYVADALKYLGYRVLDVGSGEEALALAAMHPEPIDLLISDVVLPGMNGRELSESFALLHSEAQVLFTSGYTGDAIARRGVAEGRIAFLQKPFSAEMLEEKVGQLLMSSV